MLLLAVKTDEKLENHRHKQPASYIFALNVTNKLVKWR